MIFKKKKRRYETLQAKAKKMVEKEPITENYDGCGVGELMRREYQLRSKSRAIIPGYVLTHSYDRISFDEWYRYERFVKKENIVNKVIKENFRKYGMSDFSSSPSSPFFYKVDSQYKRLKKKPTLLVERFFRYNKNKREISLCSRFFGGIKVDANYFACHRVLLERGKLKE